MCMVAPSLLAADFIHLREQLAVLEKNGIERLHIDIMDGTFVPGLSFGPEFVANIRPYTKLYFDLHLMVMEPIRFLEAFARAGADGITIHYEACADWGEALKRLGTLGLRAGIALKPETGLDKLGFELFQLADVIQLMTVEPGRGEQSFIKGSGKRIAETAERIGQLERMAKGEAGLTKNRPELVVDGGITLAHMKEVLEAGADVAVVGKGIFGPGLEQGVRAFNRLIKEVRGDTYEVRGRH